MSPSRKRKERLARKEKLRQKEARKFNKKCCRETEIIHPVCVPDNLYLVNAKQIEYRNKKWDQMFGQ